MNMLFLWTGGRHTPPPVKRYVKLTRDIKNLRKGDYAILWDRTECRSKTGLFLELQIDGSKKMQGIGDADFVDASKAQYDASR